MAIDLTKIENSGPMGQNLAASVKKLEARVQQHNAHAGLQRLALVCENYSQLSVEEAYHLLDPQGFQHEIEDAQPFKGIAKLLGYLRICSGLAPLILTWLSLSFAVVAYQHYLDQHQSDLTLLPFLKLWQDGLPGEILNFFWTGFLDATLLVIFLLSTILALFLENNARHEAEILGQEVRAVTKTLMQLIAADGLNRMTSDTQIDKIAQRIRTAIAQAYAGSQALSQQAIDLYNQQVIPLIKDFKDNVATLHMDLDTLANNLKSYQQQVNSLATASQSVATASTQMATSISSLASTASGHTTAAQQIQSEVAALHGTQKNMIPSFETSQRQVVTRIGQVTQDMGSAVTNMSNVANDVKSATTDLDKVAKQLTMLNPKEVRQIIDAADQLVRQIKLVSADLQNIAKQGGPAPKRTGWWPF